MVEVQGIQFPETVFIPREKIRPNEWNPNVMRDDLFNELVANFEELGFVQDVIVAPLPKEEADLTGFEYRIVDGEHRFDGLGILAPDLTVVPCKVVGITEDQQKFQTVKLNRLRGSFDRKRFDSLVKGLLKDYTFEEVAAHMAFTDVTELERMIESTRDGLPPEMRDEFDKAKDEIRTVDDLSLVLNRLFTKYGDTLPYHFMVLDFGGKEHMWVQMDRLEYKRALLKARDCMAEGVTFDSVIARLLDVLPVAKFVEAHRDFLKEPDTDQASKGRVFSAPAVDRTIDQLLDESVAESVDQPPLQALATRKVFVDLGAHNGTTAQVWLGLSKRTCWASRFGPADHTGYEVHAFEPSEGAFAKLKKFADEMPSVHAYNACAWLHDGKIKFSSDEKEGQCNVIADLASKGAKRPVIEKPCIDFPAWLRKNVKPEDHVALKMNIEGAEYDLLEAMFADDSIALVDELYVSFHHKPKMKPRYDAIVAQLKARQFDRLGVF